MLYRILFHRLGQSTNIYWEIVLVNTNFADTNITASVEFSPFSFNAIPPVADFGDPNFLNPIVQYSVTTTDVLSGNEVTNAIYLVDSGGNMTNMILLGRMPPRPACQPVRCALEVTTSTPEEWLDLELPAPRHSHLIQR